MLQDLRFIDNDLGQKSKVILQYYNLRLQHPKPKSKEECRESVIHFTAGIRGISDIPPYSFAGPYTTLFNRLKKNVVVSGPCSSQTMESNVSSQCKAR